MYIEQCTYQVYCNVKCIIYLVQCIFIIINKYLLLYRCFAVLSARSTVVSKLLKVPLITMIYYLKGFIDKVKLLEINYYYSTHNVC